MLQCALCFTTLTTTIKVLPKSIHFPFNNSASFLIKAHNLVRWFEYMKAIQIILTQGRNIILIVISYHAHTSLVRMMDSEWAKYKT